VLQIVLSFALLILGLFWQPGTAFACVGEGAGAWNECCPEDSVLAQVHEPGRCDAPQLRALGQCCAASGHSPGLNQPPESRVRLPVDPVMPRFAGFGGLPASVLAPQWYYPDSDWLFGAGTYLRTARLRN
jgi:hypothetical protein